MTLKNKIVSIVVWGVFIALPAMAALVPDVCQGDAAADGCTLGTLKQLAFNIINWLLGAAGMVALLFLLIGGIQMLMSGGNPEQIKKGKATLSNALLGLGIVFGSYLIINIVVSQLTGKPLPDLLNFF